MNVLIIIPRFTQKKGDYYDLPLGVAYISAALKSHGYSVITLNMNLHEDEEPRPVIREVINRNSIDVVCIGGLSYFYHAVKRLCKIVRGIDKHICLILGGGLVTSEPELMYDALNPNFIVHGEGEETIVELMNAIKADSDPKSIKGIAYRQHGEFIITPERDSINNLDDLPFPDLDQFGVEDYFLRQTPNSEYFLYIEDKPRLLPMITSRSCPLNCTFCYHPIGKKYRIRTLDNIVAEISQLKSRYQINTLILLDELMTVSKKRMSAFCEAIKPFHLNWVAQLKTDVGDEALMKTMRDSGCYYISYGLESANNTILDSMKKYSTVEEMERGLALTRKARIGIQGNFLFGDRAETWDTATQTLEWWRRHDYYQINLTPTVPYPGSEDYDFAVKKGIIKDRMQYIEDGCPTVNMTQMSDPEYSRLFTMIGEHLQKHRKYGEVISIEKDTYNEYKRAQMYILTVKCPHCDGIISYRNFHQRDPGIFKLPCRYCAARFDLHPTMFPHVTGKLEPVRRFLLQLEQTQQPVSFTPCIPEYRFLEYMAVLQIDWKKLNIHYFLDLDKRKIGTNYLSTYPVLPRDKATIQLRCANHRIVITPTAHVESIVQQITGDFTVNNERVLAISERLFENIPVMPISGIYGAASLPSQVAKT